MPEIHCCHSPLPTFVSRLSVRHLWEACVILLACAAGCGGDGCMGAYDYPRDDPAAAPTVKAVRARVTEQGFAALAEAVPGVMRAACEAGEGSSDSACSVTEIGGTDWIEFLLGSSSDALSFEILGLKGELRAGGPLPWDKESDAGARPYCDDTGGSTCAQILARGTSPSGNGFCRDPNVANCSDPATDYCCGAAVPKLCGGEYTIESCHSARSTIALQAESLEGNVRLELLDGASGGGMRITLGCSDDDFGECQDPSTFIRGALNLTLALEGALGDYACVIDERPGQEAGFELKSFQFIVRPTIVVGEDGRPYLGVDENQVTVERAELSLLDLTVLPASTDPACYDEDEDILGGDGLLGCAGSCAGIGLLKDFISGLFSGFLGPLLATEIVKAGLSQAADLPLEFGGLLNPKDLLPAFKSSVASIGFLAAANEDALQVTEADGHLGWNIDLDVGFHAEPSTCVPAIGAPVWIAPVPPDPGSTVLLPDPDSGELVDVPFDAALLVSEVTLARATFELFESGAFCLDLPAEFIADLSGGVFVPDIATLNLLVPGLGLLAPNDAPVDVGLLPSVPPQIHFGTGEGAGDQRDSHLQLLWPQMEVQLYPLVYESEVNALAFTLDLELGLTVLPTPTGDVQFFIDRIKLDNIAESYNEYELAFDGAGIEGFVSAFLPVLVSGDPIKLALDSTLTGIPFVPKLRGVQRLGDSGHYLGVFVELCASADLLDEDNPLCFEKIDSPPRSGSYAIGVIPAGGPGQAHGASLPADTVRVRVTSDLGPPGELEVAYRVDAMGLFHSFVGPDGDDAFTLSHPWLALPGEHHVEVMARHRHEMRRWSEPFVLTLTVDRQPPALRAERGEAGIRVQAWDDQTPAGRISIRAEIRTDNPGQPVQELPYARRSFIAADPDVAVTLWARDEAGLISKPVRVAPGLAPGLVVGGLREERGRGFGCNAARSSAVACLLALGLVAARRRRRQRRH